MKLFRITSKRGLGTIVTTGILLSAVATLGIMLVSWSNSNLTVHQNALNSQFSDQINKLNEYVIIENVWFGDTPSNFINVTINNDGTIGLNVTEIELTDTSGTNLITFPTITDEGITPGQTYPFQADYTWSNGDTINVVITTARTNIYTTQVVAPP